MNNHEEQLKFILSIISFLLIFILITILISIVDFKNKYIHETQDKNYLILSHQIKKIKDSSNIETAFLGDSSLGNAIDINTYNKISNKNGLNLALNEVYGFSGQYNFLKQVYKKNKSTLKNIYFVNSIYFLVNNTENEGFFLTSKNILDIKESYNLVEFITLYYKYFLLYQIKNLEEKKISYKHFKKKNLDNDYIIQKNIIYRENYIPNSKKIFEKNKEYYLKKINKFCKSKNLDCKFFFGPLYKSKINLDNALIKKNVQFYKKNSLYFKDTIFELNDDEVGDFPMHLKKKHKVKFTRKYYELFKNK